MKIKIGNAKGPKGDPGRDGERGGTGPQGIPAIVNGKSGESITLTAADVGAAAVIHTHVADDITGGTFPLVRGGTGAATAAGARAALETVKPVWGEATLSAHNWSFTSGVFTQSVPLVGAMANMKGYPSIGLKASADGAARKLEREAFALIERAQTENGAIRFWCGEQRPQVSVTVLFSGGVD